MVPPPQMHALHALAQRSRACELVQVDDAHHMDAYDQDPVRYWGALAGFVSKL